MANKTFNFKGGPGQYIPGIPAQNLTMPMYEELPVHLQRTVHDSDLYSVPRGVKRPLNDDELGDVVAGENAGTNDTPVPAGTNGTPSDKPATKKEG